ncbi:hypothetical protein BWK59_11665 [Flavobacterium davisii]|uniref:Uncharacterized protein n=1 Tax=Flavobacterium davisii TaxID=2906077 RepID=A0A246GGH6_9FLAO|nr:hypothetical protein [Flavobacterium davisii]OWP83227.1 hypothetical protein BWK59_11665 [Flavobacterium davisii]
MVNDNKSPYKNLNLLLTEAIEKLENNQISEQDFDRIVLFVEEEKKGIEIKKKNIHLNDIIFKILG